MQRALSLFAAIGLLTIALLHGVQAQMTASDVGTLVRQSEARDNDRKIGQIIRDIERREIVGNVLGGLIVLAVIVVVVKVSSHAKSKS
jgi:site-specific recombinase